jgi:VWFA-related protein
MIFTISTSQSGAKLRGEHALRKLAQDTGGEFFAPSRAELPEVFGKIQQVIESTYVAIYKPADDKEDNHFRPVEVKILDKGLRVRAPKGYFSRTAP